jgi:uncharacterized OB-fold protein
MHDDAATHAGIWPSPIDDPYADESTQPFWSAALEGRLIGSTCMSCGTVVMPPQPRCFTCRNGTFRWVELPGTATIYSFTVVRHPLGPSLRQVVPYVSAVVELDGTQGAGARMLVNVIDCDPDGVGIGDRVSVVFDRVSDTLAVPRFTPVGWARPAEVRRSQTRARSPSGEELIAPQNLIGPDAGAVDDNLPLPGT